VGIRITIGRTSCIFKNRNLSPDKLLYARNTYISNIWWQGLLFFLEISLPSIYSLSFYLLKHWDWRNVYSSEHAGACYASLHGISALLDNDEKMTHEGMMGRFWDNQVLSTILLDINLNFTPIYHEICVLGTETCRTTKWNSWSQLSSCPFLKQFATTNHILSLHLLQNWLPIAVIGFGLIHNRAEVHKREKIHAGMYLRHCGSKL
jgi:hypothetical protein